MSQLPASPRLLKGAIIAFKLPLPTPKLIPFQYNPANLSRSLEARTAEAAEGAADQFRLAGAPKETIKAEIELDATDALEAGENTAESHGVHPQLAALETLIYPDSTMVIANAVLLNLGVVEILPAQGPFTLFVWGPKRILPVRLSAFSVTEEAFDPNLNPIRAKVSLDMSVLTYSDLSQTHPGAAIYLSHQIVKETMARIGESQNAADVLGGAVDLV